MHSEARIRVSIEPSVMGIYKSITYEVFKRRPSVLIALDGNSSGANMVQDAKNGKRNRPHASASRSLICCYSRG